MEGLQPKRHGGFGATLNLVSVIQALHHVLSMASPMEGGNLETTLQVLLTAEINASLAKKVGGEKNL